MSVYCESIDCKYFSITNRCTAKRIDLSYHSVMTVWNGRQDYLKCKMYEQSEEAKRMLEQIRALMTAAQAEEEV